jgi:hypothetical protein
MGEAMCIQQSSSPVDGDGDNGWTSLGVKTGSVFVDDLPPTESNKPAVRQYRTIYVKNDVPVGQWSDVVSATVQP